MDGTQQDPASQSGKCPKRKMEKAELMGSHSHATMAEVTVHIFQRDGKYIARGRYQKRAFGETLGADMQTATSRLRHLLTEIEKGTYVRPKEARKRPLSDGVVPEFTLRELANEFLLEKRKTCGANTASDYGNRLAPCLDFAELPDHRKRWPLARDVDREFAIDFRQFLLNRQVTRNGSSAAEPYMMSVRHVRNCLEILRTMLAWAVRADVRKLPASFVIPITIELIGPKPQKDPLRKPMIPLQSRMAIVHAMDDWELLHLSISMILPLRFEDIAGALISDIDFSESILHLGTRFGGSDFNKARLTIQMPLPRELLSVFRLCRDSRTDGPLFRSRSAWKSRSERKPLDQSRPEIERKFHQVLQMAAPGQIQTEQDRKQAIRKLLRQMGGVSEKQIGKALKTLYQRIDLASHTRPYDIRGSVTSDMKDAGVGQLEWRYLTEHTLNGVSVNDIMNEYTGLDPAREMEKYFQHCQPLLKAIEERASKILDTQTATD